MMRLTKLQHGSKGFTIMETMIATIVFGLVLMVITTAILQFSRVYYRGVTEANTQQTARTVSDLIAQAIQFSGGTVTTTPASPTPGTAYAFCVGNQQYNFITGQKLTDTIPAPSGQRNRVLVARSLAGCTSSSAPVMNAAGSRELLSPNMRIARLQITKPSPTANLYKISIRIVYGDNDLLNNPTTATASCKNATRGTEFCAVSDITTTVVKRVE